MSDTNAWTVGRLLAWTTDYLKQQGSASPRLDAEVLLAAARGCERIALYTAYDQIADEHTRSVFREYVRRRAAGEPVAYLVGHREFFSLSFQVTRDVLIPRPETEHLVIGVLDLLKKRPADEGPARVADVGAGSGAVAVSVAKHAAHCRVTALDISAEALEVARGNADRHQVADRIEFVLSDLLTALPLVEPFDLIASNPPYVSQSEWDQLPPDVRNYEPQSALVGGPTGSETIARLIPQAAERLRPGGWLLLEISPAIEAAVHRLLAQDGHFTALPTVKDLAGLPRVVKARRN